MTAPQRTRSTGLIVALLALYVAVLVAVIVFADHIPTAVGIAIIVLLAVIEIGFLVRRYRNRQA